MVSTFRDIKSRQWWLCVEMLASEEFADTEILAKLDLWYMIQNIEIFALKIRRKPELLHCCTFVTLFGMWMWDRYLAEVTLLKRTSATALKQQPCIRMGKSVKMLKLTLFCDRCEDHLNAVCAGPNPLSDTYKPVPSPGKHYLSCNNTFDV